jgi:hypothetical protein
MKNAKGKIEKVKSKGTAYSLASSIFSKKVASHTLTHLYLTISQSWSKTKTKNILEMNLNIYALWNSFQNFRILFDTQLTLLMASKFWRQLCWFWIWQMDEYKHKYIWHRILWFERDVMEKRKLL